MCVGYIGTQLLKLHLRDGPPVRLVSIRPPNYSKERVLNRFSKICCGYLCHGSVKREQREETTIS